MPRKMVFSNFELSYIIANNLLPVLYILSVLSVEEDYHGQGMATILIQHLTAIARQKGIAQFTAEVLAQNISMLKVFRHSGLPVRQENEQEVVHVTMPLDEESP